MLQIIDDDDQQEVDKRPEFESIELLLDYLIHEISCQNNFEFIQAVIRLFLKVLIFCSFYISFYFNLLEEKFCFFDLKSWC